jgi:hypothetical protein
VWHCANWLRNAGCGRTGQMRPSDRIVVTLSLPEDLVSIARTCVANEDITECVKLVLHLLSGDIEDQAQDPDSAH